MCHTEAIFVRNGDENLYMTDCDETDVVINHVPLIKATIYDVGVVPINTIDQRILRGRTKSTLSNGEYFGLYVFKVWK